MTDHRIQSLDCSRSGS